MRSGSDNVTCWLEASASDPGLYEQVYPSTDAGELVVHCDACKTAWIAPVLAGGMSVKLTESAMRQGCDWCRSVVMCEVRKGRDGSNRIDYECPKCKEHWKEHWNLTQHRE